MSEINDLIYTASRAAYQSGHKDGILEERKRIFGLIDRHSELEELNRVVNPREHVLTEILKEVINEETN